MHADEANQAVKTGELLETGRYAFDPHDHHGPTLYYAALPIAWLRGERTLAALTETTVRIVPAIAGTTAVLLLGILAAPLGRWPALAAAAFMAVSPAAVYYSRYYIQETLLVAFTLAAAVCARGWLREGGAGRALATGVFLGLMHATKANALVLMVAILLAAYAAGGRPAPRIGAVRDALLALAAAVLISALFHSSFGTHPAGLRDALFALGHGWSRLGGETGHEKPWWYYLKLFAWHREGGVLWEQLVFCGLALGGLAFAFARWRSPAGTAAPGARLLPGVATYALVVGVVLSLTAYKTPWHAVHLVPPLAILAAAALSAITRRRAGWPVAAAVGSLALGSLFQNAWRAAFVRPADARNPLAYVHSAPDVLKVRALVEAAIARHPDEPVRIISEEYWPLPWYLRGLPQVGYWHEAPADCDGALVLTSASQVELVKPRLRGIYSESLLGLRPGFICVVHTRQ